MTKTRIGKMALVIGGSRGIGAATARALAEEGADVAMSYTDTASTTKAEAIISELRGKGMRAAPFRADQADPVQVRGVIEQVVEHFGHLDISPYCIPSFPISKCLYPRCEFEVAKRY